jgi:hypothetical protein
MSKGQHQAAKTAQIAAADPLPTSHEAADALTVDTVNALWLAACSAEDAAMAAHLAAQEGATAAAEYAAREALAHLVEFDGCFGVGEPAPAHEVCVRGASEVFFAAETAAERYLDDLEFVDADPRHVFPSHHVLEFLMTRYVQLDRIALTAASRALAVVIQGTCGERSEPRGQQ